MISIEQKEKDYIAEAGNRVGCKYGGFEDVPGYILSPGYVVIRGHLKNAEELVERMEYINENTRRVE